MRFQKKVYRALLALLLFTMLSSSTLITPVTFAADPDESALEPVNPNASADARRVLNYLANLPDRQDRRVIVGQNLSYGMAEVAQGFDTYVTGLQISTGTWVGLIGASYGAFSTPEQISAGNQILIDHWNSGGLVTIYGHFNNPWTGGDSWDLTSRDLVELITPGTAVNDVWMAELDIVAAGLRELRDAGVVVLWRAFPEMNYRDCFWWDMGAVLNDHPKQGPEAWRAMWRHMFDYFTYTKGLDNLLWVYAAADMDHTGWNDVDYVYPGNEYVDIVGIDVYNDSGIIGGDGYAKLLATGKPFALTERGPGFTHDGSFDNRNTIEVIRNQYPQAVYVLYWHSWPGYTMSIVENQNAAALLSDPWVITREEIDWRSELPSDEISLDNTDARFSTSYSQDAWQEYVEAGGQHYGGTHWYNLQMGTGQDIAAWPFTVPNPGTYEVYAWWWGGEWRPTDVPYTVHHYNGATTVRVDQRFNGGQWNLLGSFYFQDEGAVVVSDEVSSGEGIVADAIKLVYHSESPPPTPTPLSTSTPTATPTYVPTNTPTATATDTPTLTITPTAMPTHIPTETPTAASTNTPTPTVTPTHSSTNTPTAAPTYVPTNAPTATPTDIPTLTITPTAVPAHTPTETLTATPTNTPTPTVTPTHPPTNTPTATATSKPTATASNTPTNTPTKTPSPTNMSTPMPTNTPSPTSTPTPLPTNTPTATTTNTPTETPSPVHLTIDEPLYTDATAVSGSGAPGKTVVVIDLNETRIFAAGLVNDNGRYNVDLSGILQTYGMDGLEAEHIIQAEMEGQVYKTVVQSSAAEGGYRLFLPVVVKQSLP